MNIFLKVYEVCMLLRPFAHLPFASLPPNALCIRALITNLHQLWLPLPLCMFCCAPLPCFQTTYALLARRGSP